MVVAAHMLGAIGRHADYSTLFSMYQNPRLSELYRNKASIGAGADFFKEAGCIRYGICCSEHFIYLVIISE